MNTWFTSDLHFYHSNIIKFCNRPFVSKEDMNEHFIKVINEHVLVTDTLYNLGDFSFGKFSDTKNILRRINCKNHHFIIGNHDQELVKNSDELLCDGLLATIQHYKEIKINNTPVVLCHYPMRQWNRSHHGAYQLFGHVHGGLAPLNTSVDVGVDSTWINGTAPIDRFILMKL